MLQSQAWLNDNIIRASQDILAKEFPDVKGFQTPQSGRKFNFKQVLPSQKYVQALHTRKCHWILISNIQIAQNVAIRDRVFVYDSLLPKKLSEDTKKQVYSLLKPAQRSISFDIMNIMPQPNFQDCGLFTIANMVEVLAGRHPAKSCWDVTQMRSHLLACLEEGKLKKFPVVKERRCGGIRASIKEHLHCICFMPYDGTTTMIQCGVCQVWFHGECVKVNVAKFAKRQWYCNHCLKMVQ